MSDLEKTVDEIIHELMKLAKAILHLDNEVNDLIPKFYDNMLLTRNEDNGFCEVIDASDYLIKAYKNVKEAIKLLRIAKEKVKQK